VVTKRPNEDHCLHTCRESLFEELARGGHVCGHGDVETVSSRRTGWSQSSYMG
jgi:hypothetical protein